ncbi:MAG: VOC family protein [Leptotrichiaceae bacterium]|nr:VOC family protein [Leptotrichiaceae bacterium]
MDKKIFQPALVPELSVSDIEKSLKFYIDICGFEIVYERKEEKFAYIRNEAAEIMLEETGVSRNWVTGKLEYPFGRGINFEINLSDIDSIYEKIKHMDSLYMEMEEKWYRQNEGYIGVKQFLCQDPDGYLLRFQKEIGYRKK